MVGVWALLLGGGAWFAPAFASGGNDEDTDPRDEAPTTAASAAWSYLRYGSNGDLERANGARCDRADPEMTPEELEAIRDEYAADHFEGRTPEIDIQTEDPVPTEFGSTVSATVFYISQGNQRFEDFTVTVQENDGEYCVSDAVRLNEPDESGEGETEADPVTVASEYLTQVFRLRDSAAAEQYQCDDYDGYEIEDIEQAIADWEVTNGDSSGYLNGLPAPVEGATADSEVFEAEVVLDGLGSETFVFTVGVQEGCVTTLEGGESLMPAEED